MTDIAKIKLKKANPDVSVRDEGTVVAFTFNTSEAKKWATDSLQIEDWQWLGDDTLAVDHRMSGDIAHLLQEEGFTLS